MNKGTRESVEIFSVHVVAPEEYKGAQKVLEMITEDIEDNPVTVSVTAWEYTYDSLKYWAEQDEIDEPDALIMFEGAHYTQNLTGAGNEHKGMLDAIKQAKIRLSKTKFIIILSKEREKDLFLLNELFKLNLHNFYFVGDRFTEKDLKEWLFAREKTLRDNEKYFQWTEGGSAFQPKARQEVRLQVENTYTGQEQDLPYPDDAAQQKEVKEKRIFKIPHFPKMPELPSMPSMKLDIGLRSRKSVREIIGNIEIGVGAMSQRSAGCTHLALATASYLVGRGRKVALVEYNDTPTLYFLMRDADEELHTGFRLNGIDIYPQTSEHQDPYNVYQNINRAAYEYIVIDFGVLKRLDGKKIIQHTESYKKLWSTNFQLVALNGSYWGYNDIEYFRSDNLANVEPHISEWRTVVNLTPSEKIFKEIKERIHNISTLHHIYRAPYISDPMKLDEKSKSLIREALGPVLPHEYEDERGAVDIVRV